MGAQVPLTTAFLLLLLETRFQALVLTYAAFWLSLAGLTELL